jgi:hypothetical protein
MNYPVNYFFSTMHQFLPDGRPFGIVMSDGIGSATSNKLSSEDFLTLNGIVYKLDVTILNEDVTDLMSIKHLKSVNR